MIAPIIIPLRTCKSFLSLLVKLTENCNEIDRKSFEEFISKPKNSSEAKEMVAYYLTLENDES